MPVVCISLPDEDLAFLKRRKENVSELVRRAVHEQIEWMRFQEARERLEAVRFKPSRPVEEMIREDRDRGH